MDTELIVGLNKDDKLYYTCVVCKCILEEPKLFKCCSALICKRCIESWFERRKRCPHCNTRATNASLLRPPSMALFSISRLKVICEHKDRGCSEVLRVNQMAEHSKTCRYSLCQDCGQPGYGKPQHNCLQNMKTQIESLQRDNEQLRHQLNQ